MNNDRKIKEKIIIKIQKEIELILISGCAELESRLINMNILYLFFASNSTRFWMQKWRQSYLDLQNLLKWWIKELLIKGHLRIPVFAFIQWWTKILNFLALTMEIAYTTDYIKGILSGFHQKPSTTVYNFSVSIVLWSVKYKRQETSAFFQSIGEGFLRRGTELCPLASPNQRTKATCHENEFRL